MSADPDLPAGLLQETGLGVVVRVHAVPGARTEGVAGTHGGRLRVRVAAPAVDGRANERLVEVLAEGLGRPRATVRLLRGAASRAKEVLFEGLSAPVARRRLAELLAGSDRAAPVLEEG